MLRTAVNVCVWATCASVTMTALMLAHMVGRGDELEARVLALFRDAMA